jgi:hypothetical protein
MIHGLINAQSNSLNNRESRILYLSINHDVAKAKLDPWEHYQTYGVNEGRIWPGCKSSF